MGALGNPPGRCANRRVLRSRYRDAHGFRTVTDEIQRQSNALSRPDNGNCLRVDHPVPGANRFSGQMVSLDSAPNGPCCLRWLIGAIQRLLRAATDSQRKHPVHCVQRNAGSRWALHYSADDLRHTGPVLTILLLGKADTNFCERSHKHQSCWTHCITLMFPFAAEFVPNRQKKR